MENEGEGVMEGDIPIIPTAREFGLGLGGDYAGLLGIWNRLLRRRHAVYYDEDMVPLGHVHQQ